MKTTSEFLQKQWSRIGYKDGGFLQIDVEHPLEWHIGYQSVGQRTLVLVCNSDIGNIDSSKSMHVKRRKRETDNRWTLSFELLRNEQHEVFSVFCSDIIEYSSATIDEKEALSLVINRYKQWSRLLESQKSGLMDEQKRKGLIGELLFLEERIEKTSASVAVKGWMGADGADQDFTYSDGWFEIKSVGVSAASVTISSLEQLGCSGYGELVIMRIDKTAPEKEGAISLNDVVYRINRKLSIDIESLDLFQKKLNNYGYIDLQEYSEQKYFYSGTQKFIINSSFPRLSKQSVPKQIISTHYELDLPSLTEWQKE